MRALRTLTVVAVAALVAAGCSGEGEGEGAVPDTAGGGYRSPEAVGGTEVTQDPVIPGGAASGRDSVVRDTPSRDSIVMMPETTLPMPDTGR